MEISKMMDQLARIAAYSKIEEVVNKQNGGISYCKGKMVQLIDVIFATFSPSYSEKRLKISQQVINEWGETLRKANRVEAVRIERVSLEENKAQVMPVEVAFVRSDLHEPQVDEEKLNHSTEKEMSLKDYGDRLNVLLNEAKESEVARLGIDKAIKKKIKKEFKQILKDDPVNNQFALEKLLVFIKLVTEKKLSFSRTLLGSNTHFIEKFHGEIEDVLSRLDVNFNSQYVRDHKRNIIFDEKGFNLIIDHLKKKEKYQQLDCQICKGAKALVEGIKQIQRSNSPYISKSFAVWNDDNQLEHMLPVFVEKKDGKCRILITSSTGETWCTSFLESFLGSSPIKWNKNVEVYVYQPKRQHDHSNCFLFTLEDIKHLHVLKQKGFEIFKFLKELNLPTQGSDNIFSIFKFFHPSVYSLNVLPPSMMATTQSLSQIGKYLNEEESRFDSESLKRLRDKVEKHTVLRVGDLRRGKSEQTKEYNNLIHNHLWKYLGIIYSELLTSALNKQRHHLGH